MSTPSEQDRASTLVVTPGVTSTQGGPAVTVGVCLLVWSVRGRAHKAGLPSSRGLAGQTAPVPEASWLRVSHSCRSAGRGGGLLGLLLGPGSQRTCHQLCLSQSLSLFSCLSLCLSLCLTLCLSVSVSPMPPLWSGTLGHSWAFCPGLEAAPCWVPWG